MDYYISNNSLVKMKYCLDVQFAMMDYHWWCITTLRKRKFDKHVFLATCNFLHLSLVCGLKNFWIDWIWTQNSNLNFEIHNEHGFHFYQNKLNLQEVKCSEYWSGSTIPYILNKLHVWTIDYIDYSMVHSLWILRKILMEDFRSILLHENQ